MDNGILRAVEPLNELIYFKEDNNNTISVEVVSEDNIKLPQYATCGSAGVDLRSAENSVVPARSRCLVHTGLRIKLPAGYELQIRPRSGMTIKYGITVLNSPGTIDSDYTGEIGVILYNTTDKDFVVNQGDRIAQAVLSQYTQIEWEAVEFLEATERGDGGFGHSGVK